MEKEEEETEEEEEEDAPKKEERRRERRWRVVARSSISLARNPRATAVVPRVNPTAAVARVNPACYSHSALPRSYRPPRVGR